MPTCSFCRKSFKEPRGLTIFTFDGRAVHYCSSKCRRNAALGRDGRKMNWTKGNISMEKEILNENNSKAEKNEKNENNGSEKA